MNIKISHKLNFIGVFALVAGILLGLLFLTMGLLVTFYCIMHGSDTNIYITVFLFLILIGGIAFSVMLIKVGIGVLRRRSLSRVLLIISFYLASAGIILYLFSSIIEGLKEMGSEYFGVSSWIGIVFCLFVGTLCVFQALFLNRPDVKELFKNRWARERGKDTNDKSKKQAEGVFKNWPHSGFGIASFVIFIVTLICYVFGRGLILHSLGNWVIRNRVEEISMIGWIIGLALSIIGLFQDFRKKFFVILSFVGYLLLLAYYTYDVIMHISDLFFI